MPAYNSELYINEAMDSVLNQTFQDFELIVVDDGSEDQTVSIVTEKVNHYPDKIIVIQHEYNMGAAQSRNTALRHAKADVIMFADADDIQDPKRMEKTYQSLLQFNTDLIFNDCLMINKEGFSLNRAKGYPYDLNNHTALLQILKRNQFWIGLTIMRKSDDVFFDTSLASAEDFELFLRLFIKGYTFKIVPEQLTNYRLHAANLSSDTKKAEKSILHVMKKIDLNRLMIDLLKQHSQIKVKEAIAAAYMWRQEYEKVIHLLMEEDLTDEGSFLLASSYVKQKRWEESYQIFKRLTSISDNLAVYNNFAVLLVWYKQDMKQAEQILHRILQREPEYLDAQHNIDCINEDCLTQLRLTARPLREKVAPSQHYLHNEVSDGK